MIPGRDVVVFCPACRAPARVETLISGNTCGRVVWSDGYARAPMLPQPPALVACGACGKVHWLHQAIEGEALPGRNETLSDDQRVWSHAPYVEAAKAAEVLPALENGLAADGDLQAEFDARRFAWWDNNHPYRERNPATPVPMNEPMVHNLDRMLEIMREHDDGEERLLKAEIQRELGRFDEAIAEMRFAFFTEETPQASFKLQLETLCEKGNPNVCLIEFFRRRPPQ